jgi:hypothetical protein
VNWNFQEILTKDPSSAWGCDTSGNIPLCGVAQRRTCRCTEFHRVKNANLPHPSAMCWLEINYLFCSENIIRVSKWRSWNGPIMLHVRFWGENLTALFRIILKCMLIKVPTRCNSMQPFIYCRVTLHVSGVTAPIIRSTKTVSATSAISHGTGTATSFHRPDQATVEGSSGTSIMTYTRGSRYSFSTPDNECCDTRNM